MRKNELVRRLAGQRFQCTQRDGERAERLELSSTGDATLGRRRGRWGAMNDPTIGEERCPVRSCLFVDLQGQEMNAQVGEASLIIYHNHYRVRAATERAQPEWRCEAD